ncbi:PRC-barrel domain containing protein [Sphingopyxis sp. PAMC25046]|nr:PRC-barrel domain-containing protein [Sphingopyxis sp. PAMC25046]QCB57031.1 PRC-barrel domain containing protein [Sphingopyxis sp. PAMC25046]
MIAAMMTAANLGARVTGWGFVVFTAGSIAWSIVGISTSQTNLVATNIFLTLVNLVGIWRWLGRQRRYEDGARGAERRSQAHSAPSLLAASGMRGLPVSDIAGEEAGHVVDAMISCDTAQMSYLVIASGGIGGIDESLRAVPATEIDFHPDGLILLTTHAEFGRRAELEPGEWPAAATPSARLRAASGSQPE